MRKLKITDTQEKFLLENYQLHTHAQIAEMLGVTKNRVSYWAMELHLSKKRRWEVENYHDGFFHHDPNLSTI